MMDSINSSVVSLPYFYDSHVTQNQNTPEPSSAPISSSGEDHKTDEHRDSSSRKNGSSTGSSSSVKPKRVLPRGTLPDSRTRSLDIAQWLLDTASGTDTGSIYHDGSMSGEVREPADPPEYSDTDSDGRSTSDGDSSVRDWDSSSTSSGGSTSSTRSTNSGMSTAERLQARQERVALKNTEKIQGALAHVSQAVTDFGKQRAQAMDQIMADLRAIQVNS